LSQHTIPISLKRGKYSPMMRRKSAEKYHSVYQSFYRSPLKTKKLSDFFGRDIMNSKKSNEPSFSFGAKL